MLSHSKLGFGLMRLPLDSNHQIDIETVKKMVDTFMESGFNYFDTAWAYEGSEAAMKEALVDRYPRDRYTVADKLPKWGIKEKEDVIQIFNESLNRCGLEYFDFYLLHAMNAQYYQEYTDLGCFEFLKAMKEQGKIKHIGFSFHDQADVLDKILKEHPEMEFVQLQLNYLDWEDEKVQSRKIYETARKYNVPIIVMEPVKGGTLAQMPEKIEAYFKAYDPTASIASWALRYINDLEGVMTILSGMSNQNQLMDNIQTMKEKKALNKEEKQLIEKVTQEYLALPTIQCTRCKYCMEGCPMQIAIPDLFTDYNHFVTNKPNAKPKEDYQKHTQKNGLASACIKCGQCTNVCPQHLPIFDLLELVANQFE